MKSEQNLPPHLREQLEEWRKAGPLLPLSEAETLAAEAVSRSVKAGMAVEREACLAIVRAERVKWEAGVEPIFYDPVRRLCDRIIAAIEARQP